MKNAALLLSLAPMGMAFPFMMGGNSREDMLNMLEETKRTEEKRGLLSSVSSVVGTVTGDLTNVIGGLVESVAAAVNPNDKRPEPGYTFQAPGPNDSRGPCPGLNLLANYGYLPRDGYVNYEQVLDATARGFNMGADLATVLAVFAILSDGNITTESWYLGTGPDNVGGLNRHSTVEADISPNREDYYNACGQNHALSSYRFAQNVKIASEGSGLFDYATMASQWSENADFTKKNNPFVYFFPFPSIVSVAAYNFYPEFFSNGTYGAGGVPNYKSISSIIGAQYDESTGHFEYVPERWPEEGWYRRSTEYGAVAALTDGFTRIYPSNPVGMPFGQLGTDNLNVQTILCTVYQGINSILPLAVAGQYEETDAAVTWALSKLANVGISDTILGCPTSTISQNFLYPNASQEGGPLNPPPSVEANTGNNVYNKVYFTTAPTTPQC